MLRNNYTSLSSATLQALRDKFKHITTVIIDEISMVSYNLFEVIHKRLTEIKDTANSPNLCFGGLNIICVGDLLQLKPVFGSYILHQTMTQFICGEICFKLVF